MLQRRSVDIRHGGLVGNVGLNLDWIAATRKGGNDTA
jgi:hypothetical protein